MSWFIPKPSWLSKNSSTEQETTTAQRDDKRNSITARESDVDKELEHDEMQPHKMQRNTDEQSLVIYGREQGSSSNSQLSCDNLDWLSSYDPAKYPKIVTLKEKIGRLFARRRDILTELEHAEFQPGKKRREEVHHWLTLVPRKKDEILSVIKDDEGSSSNSNLHGHIERFIKEVDELFQRGRFPNGLVVPDQESTRLPLLLGKELIGINFKQNAKKILEWLQNHEHSIIGVWGMGGVGKTTLLLHIHDQLLKDPNLYGKVYWVTVSQNCTVQKLQEDIAKVIGVVSLGEDDERKRASILHNKLASMGPIILILDDMWERFLGEKVGIPLEGSSCKLIISTRRHDVCLKMGCKDYVIKAEILSDVEAWGLFVDKLGHYDKLEEEAKKLARSVAQECACLPLAIATMASSMIGVVDINEWKNVLNELECRRDQDDMYENVLPILQVSYDRLKEERDKNCFLSCILYGEDVKIKRDTLIEMWINEGLFDEIESWEDQVTKGHSILNKLESWCLLESCLEDGDECVKMHDLVRDMAISITQKHPRFMAKASEWLEEVPNEEQWSKDLVKVSLSHNFFIKEIPSGMAPMTPNLTVLMLNSNGIEKIPESFFRHMKALKVLDLSDTSIDRVPHSVSGLVNLKALLLRNCVQLTCVPESFFKDMKALQVLDLSDTSIKKLPESVSDLQNLRKLSFTIDEDTYYDEIEDEAAGWYVSESFFKDMKALQVLDLSNTPIIRVPESVSDLEHLRKLLLKRCHSLEYVPSVEKLRKLRVLDLTSCSKLKAAPKGLERLKSVELRGYCPWDISNMRGFKKIIQSYPSYRFWIRDPTLFTTESKFWDIDNDREVAIKGWEYREEESSWMLPRAMKLLEIEKSDMKGRSLEDVLPSLGLGFDKAPNILEEINLEECRGMISITKVRGELDSFFYLENLMIGGCEDMKVVFSFTEHPPLLPYMEILWVRKCKEVEEIFQSNERVSQCVSPPPQSNPIILSLPNLVELHLENLPKLKVPITEKLHLPKLKELWVEDCEEVEEIFHSNDGDSQSNPIILSLPNLVELELEDLPKLKWVLPITEKLHLPKLKKLWVRDCEEVEEIFHSNDGDSQSNPIIFSLPNLEELHLYNLPKLKWVLPITQLHLPKLKILWVNDCKEVEEIFHSNDGDSQSNHIILSLPNLEELSLIKLPKLKLPITEKLHLPNLKQLWVKDFEEVEEIFQSNERDSQSNPIILSLPNLEELYLYNLPKLKWVLPITEKLHLPKLKILTVGDCEEMEEIFQIFDPDLGLPNFERLTLENLPKLKWVFPFTEHPLHLILLKIKVLNCSMLQSICRGLILFPSPSKDFHVENCSKLKVFRFEEGKVIVDSKSTIECILNNTQFWEKLQQDYPDKARLLSHFTKQRMELWQGLDDDNDDGGVDGDGAEGDGGADGDGGVLVLDDDDRTTWGASLSLLPF